MGGHRLVATGIATSTEKPTGAEEKALTTVIEVYKESRRQADKALQRVIVSRDSITITDNTT